MTSSFKPSPISYDDWRAAGERFRWQGSDIFYRTMGDGPPLMLIHGFPTCGWDWSWIAQDLAAHFKLIIPDLAGMGQSRAAKSHTPTMGDQAAMIDALAGHLGASAYHVLAHDVGDTVVQELLARQQERYTQNKILSAGFLNGGLHPDFHHPPEMLVKLAGPFGGLMMMFANKNKLLDALAATFDEHTRPEGDDLLAFWPGIQGVHSKRSIARRTRYLVERRLNASRWIGGLRGTTIPKILIFGMTDPISGAHMFKGVRSRVDRIEAVALDRIGHYPHIEAPDAVAAAFLQFHRIEV